MCKYIWINTHSPHPEINCICSPSPSHWYLSFYCYWGKKNVNFFALVVRRLEAVKQMHHSHVYLVFLSKDQKEANLIGGYMNQGWLFKRLFFLSLTFLSCSIPIPHLCKYRACFIMNLRKPCLSLSHPGSSPPWHGTSHHSGYACWEDIRESPVRRKTTKQKPLKVKSSFQWKGCFS